MGKVIAAGPGGKAQAPVRDDRARPVIAAVVEAGMLGQLLISPPCVTRAKAEELRLALYRSARYWCSCGEIYCTRKHANYPTARNPQGGCPRGGQRISCDAGPGEETGIVTVTDPENGRRRWAVQFRLHDKKEAIRLVVQRYGPDPNQWPYFARRKERRTRNA